MLALLSGGYEHCNDDHGDEDHGDHDDGGPDDDADASGLDPAVL